MHARGSFADIQALLWIYRALLVFTQSSFTLEIAGALADGFAGIDMYIHTYTGLFWFVYIGLFWSLSRGCAS